MVLRLTLVFLFWFSWPSAFAATPWVAHYFPANPPGAVRNAQAVALDASGNIFAVSQEAGQTQTCVLKLDSKFNQVADSCFRTGGLQSIAAAVDPQGNLVVAGDTSSTASLQLVSPLISKTVSAAGFIIKFNSNLSEVLFSTLLGGTMSGSLGASTNISAMALDPAGNIYVAGWTADGNFPLTTGAFQTTPPTDVMPAFVTAISAAGDRFLWSTLLAGPKGCTSGTLCADPGTVRISAIAVDSTGAVVIAGSVANEQIPVTPGVLGPTCLCTISSNSPTSFLARLTSSGSQLAWATYLNYAYAQTLALDVVGNVIIGGQAGTGFTATSGALQTTFPVAAGTEPDAGFVAKINASAQQYLFATFLGSENFQQNISSYEIGPGPSGVTALALDSSGTIWTTGGSVPSTLPLPASTPILGTDYLIGLSPDGSTLTSAMTIPEGGAGLGVAISPQGPVTWGQSGSILLPTPAAPSSLAGIANSAGPVATAGVAPNELVSFYGVGLGPSTALSGSVVNGMLPDSLGGVQVQFDGQAAPLLYAGPNQINAVVPSRIAAQTSTLVTIVTPAGPTAAIALAVASAVPEVFTYGPPGAAAIAVNQGGTLNSATNPAAQGSIVTVWASGGGLTGNPEADGAITGAKFYPLALPLSVGNGFPGAVSIVPVPIIPTPQVKYSGDAPDLVKGTIQVNFSIPQYPSPASPGAAQFFLQVGSATSDPFTVYVQ